MGKWSKPHPAKRSVECVCGQCGGKFDAPAWRVAQGKGRYCSKQCYRLGSRVESGVEVDGLWFAQGGGNRYYWHKWPDKRVVSLHRYVWEKHNGPVPAGHHVHHIDHDPANNDISNLELVAAKQHSREHLAKRIASGALDAQAALAAAREAAKVWHGSDAGREWHRQNALSYWAKRREQEKRGAEQGL